MPGSEDQKLHVFSHMWNIELIKIQQYYEKQVMLRKSERVKERRQESEYGWYTLNRSMNIEFLSCLNHHKEGTKVE
jgi:hypothetical protein